MYLVYNVNHAHSCKVLFLLSMCQFGYDVTLPPILVLGSVLRKCLFGGVGSIKIRIVLSNKISASLLIWGCGTTSEAVYKARLVQLIRFCS